MKNEDIELSNPFMVKDDDIGLRTPVKKKLYTISESAKLMSTPSETVQLSSLLSYMVAIHKNGFPNKEYIDYGYLVGKKN